MAYTFVIFDESINSNGFAVLTRGIDLTRFLKNPIMLYMHERGSGIVGRWENIRIEGTELLADGVFDKNDPIGKLLKEKVDNGFIRSASIGVSDIERKDLNGVETIVKCVLNEVSIVDIPSNKNAVKLFRKSGECVYNLADLAEKKKDDSNDFVKSLIEILELDKKATHKDILNTVKRLIENKPSVEQEIKKALKYGFIDKSEIKLLNTFSQYDSNKVLEYIDSRKDEQTDVIEKAINEATGKGKFIHQDKSIFEEIGREMGAKKLNILLSSIHSVIKPMDIIGASKKDKSNWGLDEYRKFAPLELKDNPALYESLLQKEGKEPSEYSLDYYRKNNPEYLIDNPDVYKKMINKELK